MTDTSKADTFHDILRMLTTIFDRPAYWLLGISYQIFFNVASADLLNNATILGFYKRIQLIIGVFMIFQLAVTILKGIVSPDEAFGAKSGIGSIITRVITALVLLTVLVPVSIPGATTEYERQINNNGLLFGTLYSLQHRILANNTLGRLVLGTTDEASGIDSDDETQAETLKRSSRIFTATILKGFIRINLVPEEYRVTPDDGRSEEMINENRVCKDIDDAVLEAYTRVDADPGEIISLITADCTVNDSEDWLNSDLEKTKSTLWTKIAGRKKYVFAHELPFVSSIVGFIFVFILLSYTIEIAIRAAKLAVLRLIAPIPIISYMDPKGSKDGAFNSWVKSLTSTYLDLFVRLAIIYFVIYLIQDMIVNGIVINTGSGMVGVLSFIAIWIGLFAFAKQAPKFIRQVLGMKEDSGGGLFKGFAETAGVFKSAGHVASRVGSAGIAVAGTVGSFMAGRHASETADEVNGTNTGTLLNRGKHLAAGILSGAMGLGSGLRTAFSKDGSMQKTLNTIQNRNARMMNYAQSGGTFWGGVASAGRQVFTGTSRTDELEAQWKAAEEEIKYERQKNAQRKTIMDRASSKGLESLKTSANITGFRGNSGKTYNFSANAAKFNSAYAAAQAGSGVRKTYVNGHGGVFTQEQYNALTDAQKQYWQEGASYFNFNGVDIDMNDAALLQHEINDGNIANYAEMALADASMDAVITAANSRFASANNGVGVETTFGGDSGLKATYGSVSNNLDEREMEIANQKNSKATQRAQAQDRRFSGK